jgi:hypothetical protein
MELLELVEHRAAALQQRAAIHRGLDALRPAVEKPHTKCVFERCNPIPMHPRPR